MKRLLLLSLSIILLSFSLSAQVINDDCDSALRLCDDFSFVIGKRTNFATSASPKIMKRWTENQSVWFKVEGFKIGGDFTVTVEDTGSLCGLEVEVFDSSCAGDTLGTFFVAPGTINSKLFGPTDSGRMYYIVVNMPDTCSLPGEFFDINVTTSNNGIIGAPEPDFITDPVWFAECDTAIGIYTNKTTRHGGVIDYFWDLKGGGRWRDPNIVAPDNPDPLADSNVVDTFYFPPCQEYEVELKACNECHYDVPAPLDSNFFCDNAPFARRSAYALNLEAKLDTIDPKCAGNPIGLVIQGDMQPQGVFLAGIYRMEVIVYENCKDTTVIPPVNCKDSTRYIIGDPTVNPLPDTLTLNPLVIIWDTLVSNPNHPTKPGLDTIWHTTSDDTIYVKVDVDGNCSNSTSECPDTTWKRYELPAPMVLTHGQDTVLFCAEDLNAELCDTVRPSLGSGLAPFTYEWYYLTINDTAKIDSVQIADTIHCVQRANLDSLVTLKGFWPVDYENTPLRFIVRVTDTNGCFADDTIYLKLFKPVIDTAKMLIVQPDSTLTCATDTNTNQTCLLNFSEFSGYCPGDSIAFTYTVRGLPPFAFTWDRDSTTGLFGAVDTSFTDSIVDTAWIKSRSITADFTLQLIVTDSMDCQDTFQLCFPVHEPPTIDAPDSICVTSLSDSIIFNVNGSCPLSIFSWDSSLAQHNYLLKSISPPDSFIYFDWQMLGISADSLLDSIFLFAVEVHDSATGCTDTANLTFQFDSSVAVCLTASDSGVCDGFSVTLSDGCDTSGVTYTWIAIPQGMARDTFAIDTSYSISHAPTDTTLYIVVASRSGCQEQDSVTVNWYPNPVASAVELDSICLCGDDSLNGTGSDTSGMTYLWSSLNGNVIADPTALITTITVCVDDTITLRVTDTLTSCFTDTSITVEIDSIPAPIISVTDSICFGGAIDTIILNGKGSSGANLSYFWYSTPPVTIADPTADSTYALASDTTTFCLVVTDTVLNCDDTACDFLNLYIPFTLVATDSGFCQPDLPDTATICVSGASSNSSYDWSLTASPFDTMIVGSTTDRCVDTKFDTIGTFIFQVAVFDSVRGCPDTLSYSFVVSPGDVTLAVTSDTICGGETDTIIATGVAICSWSANPPGAVINCLTPPFCDSVEVTPTVNTTFVVNTWTGACQDEDSIAVAVITPSANAGPDIDTCQGSVISLAGAGSGGSILWSSNGGTGSFSDSLIATPTYTPHPDSAGVTIILTMAVTDTFGMCGTDIDTALVNIDSLPVINSISATVTIPPDTICACDTVLLNSTTTAVDTYSWTDNGAGGTFTPSNSVDSPKYVLCAGVTTPQSVQFNLTASASTSACEPVEDSVSIVVMPLPVSDAGTAPIAICQGGNYTFNGTSVGGTVSWSHTGAGTLTNSTTDTPTYYSTTSDPASIVFTMIVSSALCGNDTSSVTLTINTKPAITLTADNDSICDGTDVLLKGTGTTTYHWYYKDGTGTWILITTTTTPLDTLTQSPLTTTDYMLVGETGDNCMDTAYTTVTILPNPIPTLTDPVYSVGDCYPMEVKVIYIAPAEVSTYQWDFGDGSVPVIDPLSPFEVTHEYTKADSVYPVIYTIELTVVYSYGTFTCTNNNNVKVEVCEEFKIPNAFTPNGDGINDFFIIDGTDFANCRLVVFNRWGTKVFEANNYQNDWNGDDLSGNKLESDTYYYVYICDDERTWTGWIKLIR